MLHAYVDESERDDTYYFLGALIVNESQADYLTRELDSLVSKHAETFPALAGVELHGSTMMRAKEKPWRGIPLRLRFRILEEVLEHVDVCGARIYIEGINIRRQHARYTHPTAARELAFSHLFERINECCTVHEPKIRVIADEHHTSDISRSNFNTYRSIGTYGYRSSNLPHIDPQIDFIPSDTSRVLQAADIITYLYNRLMTVPERDARAHQQKHRMWQIVQSGSSYPNGRTRIWP
ncbi:DUF3800 domain-containing protein [Curtobacterium sp. RRHDQ66]|uniref:DUF3800 domain-containing protein n=1 Tax=Curtobacterium guangdongense TaxID=3413380 RepID=UPI003BF3D315